MITLYNTCLDNYYVAYEDYYTRAISYELSAKWPIIVRLVLKNEGGAPAEDIDIELKFPIDGPEPFADSTDCRLPRAPVPPQWIDTNNLPTLFERYRSYEPYMITNKEFYLSKLRLNRKTEEPLIKFQKGSQWTSLHKLAQLKHNFDYRLPRIRLAFHPNDFRSFNFECNIYVGNLKDPERKTLNVLIR